jgi:hypothetical protein
VPLPQASICLPLKLIPTIIGFYGLDGCDPFKAPSINPSGSEPLFFKRTAITAKSGKECTQRK